MVLHAVPLDLALGERGFQFVDTGGGDFGAAEVEGFQVRQVGEVLDADVGQSAAGQRQAFERLQLGQVFGREIGQVRVAERQVDQRRLVAEVCQSQRYFFS